MLCIRYIYCIICFKPHLFLTTNLTTTEAIAVHKISLKMFLIQTLFLVLFVSISTISKLVKRLLHASITGCVIAIKNASLFMNISNLQLNDLVHYQRDVFNVLRRRFLNFEQFTMIVKMYIINVKVDVCVLNTLWKRNS